MTRWLLILLLALVAGAGLWYVFAGQSQVPDLAEVEVEQDDEERPVDLSAAGVELMHGDEGRLKWRLMAQSARFLQEGGIVEVDGPEIVYMLEGMDGELHVNATQGVIEQDLETARLWPDVVAVYQDNVMNAQELTYSGAENTLRLTGGVSMAGPTITCSAQELAFDLTANILTMGPDVNATFLVELPQDELVGGQAGQPEERMDEQEDEQGATAQ